MKQVLTVRSQLAYRLHLWLGQKRAPIASRVVCARYNGGGRRFDPIALRFMSWLCNAVDAIAFKIGKS